MFLNSNDFRQFVVRPVHRVKQLKDGRWMEYIEEIKEPHYS